MDKEREKEINIRIFKDGNQWCAVFGDFINIQESDAGFGVKPEVAVIDLFNNMIKICDECGVKDPTVQPVIDGGNVKVCADCARRLGFIDE